MLRSSMVAIFLAAGSAAVNAQTESVYYAITYQMGTTSVTFTDQAQPIPVPAVGTAIDVSDGGKTISGTVDTVQTLVKREVYPGLTLRRWFHTVTLK